MTPLAKVAVEEAIRRYGHQSDADLPSPFLSRFGQFLGCNAKGIYRCGVYVLPRASAPPQLHFYRAVR